MYNTISIFRRLENPSADFQGLLAALPREQAGEDGRENVDSHDVNERSESERKRSEFESKRKRRKLETKNERRKRRDAEQTDQVRCLICFLLIVAFTIFFINLIIV